MKYHNQGAKPAQKSNPPKVATGSGSRPGAKPLTQSAAQKEAYQFRQAKGALK